MIVLHQFEPAFGLPNPSPFCMKLEAFLKLAGLPYRSVPLIDMAIAPKGKGPFIELDGRKMGDSALIIRYLEALHGIDLDRGLSPAERAAAHAFGVMLEERTYWALSFNRWIEPANWPLVRDAYLGDLPPPVQDEIRERARAELHAQGLGRHAPEEIYALAVSDIEALAAWLGREPFFMGERPTKVDATVHAFIRNLLGGPFEGPLQGATARHENLVAYDRRMMALLWPEAVRAAA